jgi:GT2 family glycosyltransferase
MISIITAVHNQLAMNKIFLEYIRKNTCNEYEIIIIDNASTDGTREFFESEPDVTVIANEYNYSYPYCQNQGIAIAKSDLYCFLNNDIIVPKNWDKLFIETMKKNDLDVVTSSGIEQVETPLATKKLKRKWKKIRNPLNVFKKSNFLLRLMHKIMYFNWDKFSEKRQDEFKEQILEGFVGNTVIIKKSAIDKIGLWDERVQAADFDLYTRVKKRSIDTGDMRPVHIALDVFVHHYIRLTAKTKYPPFKDRANLISLEDKWGQDNINEYFKDIAVLK